MSLKIDQDHSRFRQIVRGKIRQNLRKYVSQGELIGKQGKDVVSIPIPQIDIPRFRFADKQQGGVGQGDGEPGEASEARYAQQLAEAEVRGKRLNLTEKSSYDHFKFLFVYSFLFLFGP